MLNIGEAFRSQQFIGDVCRRVANESAGRDANRGGFWRRLLGKGLAATEETCHTGQRHGRQKVATIVEPLHDNSSGRVESAIPSATGFRRSVCIRSMARKSLYGRISN